MRGGGGCGDGFGFEASKWGDGAAEVIYAAADLSGAGGARIAVAGLARVGFARRVSAMPKLAELPALEKKFTAADRVTLGKTGVTTSRLAMGTGTVGGGHHSNQTALGVAGLAGLLMNGYDQGLHFIDAADSYGSHPHAAAALKQMDRSKVTVMTKSFARGPAADARGH